MKKADVTWVNEIESKVDNKLRDMDALCEGNKDDIMTLEHYTERYMPIKIQDMIIENMRLIHPDTVMARLMSEENKLFLKLQD